ncbi:MAG: hypothetical protein ABFE08_08255 [Armatimonadia bacterium]
MKKTLLLVVVMMLVAGAAMAQAIGGAVPLQEADAANVPPIPAAQVQGTSVVGDPATGKYDILINGWIEAYARVSTYDNWIDFGIMSPTSGSYAAPVSRWAFSEAGEATYALTGEDGGQTPLYEVNSSTLNFDLAGLQIQTNARLDLQMTMGGYLTRCTSTGADFVGSDTRRADGYFYQLRNQAKMVMHGKFLANAGPADPAQDAEGTPYVSPTSLTATDYNDWTNWGAGVNAINNEDGWFEPDESNDPWTGTAAGPVAMAAQLPLLNLVVERGQAQTGGTGEAAEIWWTQRILRRGLQDVAGNYRSDMMITLTYREADTQWQPTVK